MGFPGLAGPATHAATSSRHAGGPAPVSRPTHRVACRSCAPRAGRTGPPPGCWPPSSRPVPGSAWSSRPGTSSARWAGWSSTLRQALVTELPLVDEIVVMDSDSTDATGSVASRAGATVHRAKDVAPELGTFPGKGEALWKSLLVTGGDLLVFVDADLTRWGPHFVTGLLGPLLADPAGPPGQGVLRTGAHRRRRLHLDRGRPGHRAGRPPAAQPVVARAGRRGPAAGRRVGGPARPDGVAEHPGRLRGRAVHPAGHRGPATAWTRWPRWTWAPGRTSTRPTTTWP